MALHNNLKLIFLIFSLLTSITISQYDYSLDNDDDDNDSLSSQPDLFAPAPSPLSADEVEADAFPSPQTEIFAPGASPFLPSPVQSPSTVEDSIQSPSPSPSEDASAISNRYVSFPASISEPQSDSADENMGLMNFDFSNSPKVKEICDSTDHPELCQSTIAPFLKGKSDVSSVLQVAIDVTDKLANAGFSLAKSIADKPGNPPELDSILKDCKESYDTVVYNFESAKSAFPERDVGTMNSMLSAVITNVGDCEDAFARSGMDSPFTSISEKLANMTSNCLAIVSLMS